MFVIKSAMQYNNNATDSVCSPLRCPSPGHNAKTTRLLV